MKTMTTDEAFKDLRDKLRVLTDERGALLTAIKREESHIVEPVGYFYKDYVGPDNFEWKQAHDSKFKFSHIKLYAKPQQLADFGAVEKAVFQMEYENWNWKSVASTDAKRQSYAELVKFLADQKAK